jgi:hypothetical protein
VNHATIKRRIFDLIAVIFFTPLVIAGALAGFMWWQNVTLPSSVFEDPYIGGHPICREADLEKCPIPVFAPGDPVRVNYTIKRNRACTINVARVMEDIDGLFKGREQQVDYTVQTFGPELLIRPSGYYFEVPKGKPDDERVKCQKYDVYSRVQYFCNELDKHIPRFMMTDGRRESKRVRIEVCRK